MQCPYCGSDSKVLDSRQTEEGRAVRRRRECLGCMRRFTTYEKVEEMPLVVVKKDGRREPFEQSKIRRGILTACEKRPVSMEVVDELVHSIERDIRSNLVREVESRVIGEMVMDRLRKSELAIAFRFRIQ